VKQKPNAWVVVIVMLTIHTVVIAGVEVRSEFEKTFDFTQVRTWGWNPKGRGDVRMARTPEDNPEAMQQRAEPIIVEAVTTELTKRKLQESPGQPDVFVTYYLLLTTGYTDQSVGQFLPATTAWALPPFGPATQSLEFMDRGSLVIDFSAKNEVVWRGVARAKIKVDVDRQRRETLLRESVRDLLKRFPPR
jgi:uncharacterized protein DUF4136